MNTADQKINEFYQSIIQINTSSMDIDEGKNYKGELLLSLSNRYTNNRYTWELMIYLQPWFKDFSEEAISSISMELKHKKNSYKRFQIIYSPSIKKLMIENWRSTLYTRSENNEWKYPRAWNPNSPNEQYKTHKIVAWGINTLQKLLISLPSEETKNKQVNLMEYL